MGELYSRHQVFMTGSDVALVIALSEAIPGLSRNKARQAVLNGLVQIDGVPVSDPLLPCPAGVHDVHCDLSQGLAGATRRGGSARPFRVLYEDDHLAVVDKASGVIAAPRESGDRDHLLALLRDHWRAQGRPVPFLGVVHRIDQETSGCLVLALTRKAQVILNRQFAEHSIDRSYRALCWGQPRRETDTLTGRLGRAADGRRWVVDADRPGQDAVTHFELVERLKSGCDLRLRIETGRTHQIRIHLAAIGCPVAGDRIYSLRARERGLLKGLPRSPRLMLHAETLGFDHPLSGERLQITAPLPAGMAAYRRLLIRG